MVDSCWGLFRQWRAQREDERFWRGQAEAAFALEDDGAFRSAMSGVAFAIERQFALALAMRERGGVPVALDAHRSEVRDGA